jgi:hypothetical protein
LQRNPVTPPYQQGQESHYDSKANRCYTKISIVDEVNRSTTIDRYLYDAQTNDLLVSIFHEDRKAIVINNLEDDQTEFGALATINRVMREDRRP